MIQILQCPLLKFLGSKDPTCAFFLMLSPFSILERSGSDKDSVVTSIDGIRECIKLSCTLGKTTIESLLKLANYLISSRTTIFFIGGHILLIR